MMALCWAIYIHMLSDLVKWMGVGCQDHLSRWWMGSIQPGIGDYRPLCDWTLGHISLVVNSINTSSSVRTVSHFCVPYFFFPLQFIKKSLSRCLSVKLEVFRKPFDVLGGCRATPHNFRASDWLIRRGWLQLSWMSLASIASQWSRRRNVGSFGFACLTTRWSGAPCLLNDPNTTLRLAMSVGWSGRNDSPIGIPVGSMARTLAMVT